MTTSPPYHLHQSLGYQLSLAARIQEKRLDDGLKTLGLTRISWCVLLAVGVENLEHPSEIAAFVGIDRTAASRTLKSMETAGMIARQGGISDKRTTTVVITSRGHDLLRQGIPMAEANNKIMSDNLKTAEMRQLKSLLAKLHAGQNIELAKF
ncbi:MarR family winged helix-turn-helix transcriptional regulator [Algirhabdus cladophorae]|uniref:MarR family winged helix-turn-helix transcriptional regulator n=1 Tax=Algirhabdus cladophorae TaxID=3377108 RepID=UPI003B849A00